MFAYFRKTGHSRVFLVSSWNNLEADFRDSLGYLGDASRELSGCMVDFYCSSYGGSLHLRDFISLLSLEGTKSRLVYSMHACYL